MDNSDREDSPTPSDPNASPPLSPGSILKRKRLNSPDGSSQEPRSQFSTPPPPSPRPSQISLCPASPVPQRVQISPRPHPAPRPKSLDGHEYSLRRPSSLRRSMSASSPKKPSLGLFLLQEPLKSSTPAFQPLPLLSLPTHPSQEQTFKVPSLSTHKRQRRLGQSPVQDDSPAFGDIEMRRVREDTPAPLGPTDGDNKQTALSTPRPSTPAQFSGPSSPSSSPVYPKSRPQSTVSSGSVSRGRSIVPSSSPFGTKEARRTRRSIPWLSPRAANRGTRAYGPVPVDRSTLVPDVSNTGDRQRENDKGARRFVEGSKNGQYLKDEREHLQSIAESGYCRRVSEHEGARRLEMVLEEIEDQRNSWGRTIHRLKRIADHNTSTWMNETWGPPIKDSHRRELRLARPHERVEHPSTTGRLSAQYSGGRRIRDRSNLESVGGVRMQRKQHTRATSPASTDIDCAWQESSAKDAKPSSSGQRLVLRGPRPELPKEQTCSRCGEKVCGPMIECSKCGRIAFCSEQCDKDHATSFCCAACHREYGRFYQDPKKQSEDEVAASDLQNLSIMDDPGNYIMESDQDVNMDDDEDEEDEDLAPADDRIVVDHKVSGIGRTLEYQIEKTTRPKTRSWIDADLLYGPRWTEKMRNYWTLDDPRRMKRALFLNPSHPDFREPGPFGRFVVQVELVGERDLMFNVRDFERINSAKGGGDWRSPDDLWSEWDEAIADYWRRVKAAVSWYESEQMIKQMGVLPLPDIRNDSTTSENPGDEELSKNEGTGQEAPRGDERVGSPRYSPSPLPEDQSNADQEEQTGVSERC